MKETVLERFEAKFTKSDGCWEWNASITRIGYGRFRVAGETQLAHRVAYQLYIGEITTGMCVCHRCDNRKCVNPAHLFLGFQADNVHDCEDKGRGVHPSGENHYFSRLTEEQVIEIRARYSDGEKIAEIAKEFGMAHSTIYEIVRRRKWTKI